MKEKEVKVGQFVVVYGVVFVVDEMTDTGFFGSDADGNEHEFDFDQVDAVCP